MSLAAPSPATPSPGGSASGRSASGVSSPQVQPPRVSPRTPPPRLRVLAPPPATRRRLPFAAACVAILVLSLLGLLLLNIALTRGAYDVQGLQREATLLGEREQALTERLSAEAAPGRLSERAAALGMVPSTSPAFIRLSDGAVLGVPQAAEPPAAPTVAAPPAPSATPDAPAPD